MNSRLIVVGLIKKGNQVLLGQKAPGKGPYPDSWHIPGGGVDLDKEECDKALVREIKEETGLDVKNLKKVAWDTDIEPNKEGTDTYYVFLQYICEVAGGELTAGDDMHHFEWVDVSQISNYNLNEPTKILFQKLGLI